MPSWILAIDFGTSYTVAAAKVGDRSPEIGGERRMPSVVMVDQDGQLFVGRTAEDLSVTNPGGTLRALKNRLGDQTPVILGGRPYQVVNLVAAVLRGVYEQVVEQIGEPPAEVRLTHPATWNQPRITRLVEAAARAGLGQPLLVPEPVAAALSYAADVGIAPGRPIVVYDLGGGTFDSAVVTVRDGGFTVVGRPGGDQHIGGELFDELVANYVGERIDPAAWEHIQVGDDASWRQIGAALRNEARKAKEALSSHPFVTVLVPLPSGLTQVRITRDEFRDMIRPYIAETVETLHRCIAAAGVDPRDLAGISLVGGSSRSPVVEDMVRDAFPMVPISRRGDPKATVAAGATLADRPSATAPHLWRSQITLEASPGTALAAQPRPAVPPTRAVPLGPIASQSAGAPLPPPLQPGGPPTPPGPNTPGPNTPKIVIAVVVVALLAGGGTYLATRNGGTKAASSTTVVSGTDTSIASTEATSQHSTVAPSTVAPTTVALATTSTSSRATHITLALPTITTSLPNASTVPATAAPPSTAPAATVPFVLPANAVDLGHQVYIPIPGGWTDSKNASGVDTLVSADKATTVSLQVLPRPAGEAPLKLMQEHADTLSSQYDPINFTSTVRYTLSGAVLAYEYVSYYETYDATRATGTGLSGGLYEFQRADGLSAVYDVSARTVTAGVGDAALQAFVNSFEAAPLVGPSGNLQAFDSFRVTTQRPFAAVSGLLGFTPAPDFSPSADPGGGARVSSPDYNFTVEELTGQPTADAALQAAQAKPSDEYTGVTFAPTQTLAPYKDLTHIASQWNGFAANSSAIDGAIDLYWDPTTMNAIAITCAYDHQPDGSEPEAEASYLRNGDGEIATVAARRRPQKYPVEPW